MERSEHIEYSQQPVPTKINSNCENDEIIANSTSDWLFDEQLENFQSNEESYQQRTLKTKLPQRTIGIILYQLSKKVINQQRNFTTMLEHSPFKTKLTCPITRSSDTLPKQSVPQNELAVQVAKSELEKVVGPLPASVEFSPAKHFENGSQSTATLHQMVDFSTEETFTCHAGHQSTTSLTPNPRYYICTICNPSCQIVKKRAKEHLIIAHLDKFFLSSKLDSVFQNDFKKYCNYVIKKLVLSSHKLYNRDGNPLLGCKFCSYTSKREEYIHKHLCSIHEHNVKEELVRLQQNTTNIAELRKKANQLENFMFSDTYCFRCLNCHNKFTRQQSLEKHIKHSEVCMKTCGTGTSSSKDLFVTCEICDPPKQLQKRNQSLHNVRHHIETLLVSFKPQDMSKEEFKKNCESVMAKELNSCERKSNYGKTAEFVCSHCLYILKEKENLRYHFYSQHKNVFMDKLAK